MKGLLVILAVFIPIASAQRGGAFGGPGASYPTNDIFHIPDSAKAQPIVGKVRMEDGSVPPEPVLLVRVCNGFVRPGAATDGSGKFQFRHRKDDLPFDEEAMKPEDAAARVTGGFDARLGAKHQRAATCELRALLPGYRSDPVTIDNHRSELTDAGTLVLHASGGEGMLISRTSLDAPDQARRFLEESWTEASKRNYEEARLRLQKALAAYPQYASAWYEMGRLLALENDNAAARMAFRKAMEVDPKYTGSYDQLALLAARENNWLEVSDVTDQLMKLAPTGNPGGWLLAAIAKFHTGDLDAVERCARAGLEDDPDRRLPKLELLLGMVLAQKKQYADAEKLLSSYLRHAPKAPDAGAVKKQLAEMKALGEQGQKP